jgi:subtilisin family serine protease
MGEEGLAMPSPPAYNDLRDRGDAFTPDRADEHPRTSMRVGIVVTLAITLLMAGAPCTAASPGTTAAQSQTFAKLDPIARIAVESLRSGSSVNAEGVRREGIASDGSLDVFIVGATRGELEAAGARVRTSVGGTSTAYLPLAALDRVAGLASVTSIHGARRLEPELDVSARETSVSKQRGTGPLFPGINGEGVLVGTVDTGIDFDHGDFKDASGHTRLAGLWDQISETGPSPPAFGYGRLWSRAEIDAGVCTATDGSGHGTGVMGVAAGDGSQYGGGYPYVHVGMAPKADLAVVKTTLTDTGIIDGVQWIFDLATERGQSAVVNLSAGTQAGPHDGTSQIEGLLSQMSGPGRIVVKSAGNDRGSELHAETYIGAGGSQIIDFYVPNVSAFNRIITIEGYYSSAANLTLIVDPQFGVGQVAAVPRGTRNAPWPGVDTPWGWLYIENGLSQSGTGDHRIYLEIRAFYEDTPVGLWKMTFLSMNAFPAQLDMWRTSVGGPEQSEFRQGLTDRMLISEPGNAEQVITAGAWVTRRYWTGCNGVTSDFSSMPVGSLATFSSPGPTRDGRSKPDLAAPGSAIVTTVSTDYVRNCPLPPNETVYFEDDLNHIADYGTSLAAPHVAGVVALLLQRFGPLTPDQIKSYLFAHARTDAFTGATWNPDWGWGKLDVGDLLAPRIDVVSPNGTEIYLAGQTVPIHWAAIDSFDVASVDVFLSRTGRLGPYVAQATGIANTGVYGWTVPGPGTTQAFLRMVARDAAGNASDDTSDVAFRITTDTAVEPASALRFGIAAVGPTPATGSARIDYVVAREARVRLAIVDLQGREVEVLATGVRPAGRHRAEWPATGRPAPAGLYFARYEFPGGVDMRRVVLVR